MNITTAVKMTLVLFLLCSGFFHFTFASNRLRHFRVLQSEITWHAALDACNHTNESFVTLYDQEDCNFIVKFLDKHIPANRPAWLGLHYNRTTTWSDGTPNTFNKSSVNLTNLEQTCEAINNNTWRGFNCSERKYFMCSKGDNYTLIKDEKNWCQALQYCRTFFTNLVSIHNITQNRKVVEEGNNTSFWIGLLHDKWEWKDKSCSSFRHWGSNSFEIENQGTIIPYDRTPVLYQFNYDSEAHPICSKGTVRIKVIDKPLTWEEAFAYCQANHTGLLWIEDEEDQWAVEQWLNHTDVGGPFWIGLRQSRVFGFWIWSDRTVTYSKWKDNKPPEMPLSNHCGVIEKDEEMDDYRWRDENCLLQLPFLCEEEIVFMNK